MKKITKNILALSLISFSLLTNYESLAKPTDKTTKQVKIVEAKKAENKKLKNKTLKRNTLLAPESYIVYDFTAKKTLESKNENKVMPIASVTKLMTALTFYNTTTKNQRNNCYSQIQKNDFDVIKNTKTRLPKYNNLECRDLLNAMLVASDNYAAHSLSHAKMNKQSFIQIMNKTAKQLGMKQTYFKDSSGLSYKNVSTVKDLALLSKEILKNRELANITAQSRALVITPTGNVINYNNTNPLVRNYSDTVISKTGYIAESGYNLAYLKRCNDGHIKGVISLNNHSPNSRINFTRNKLTKYNCD